MLRFIQTFDCFGDYPGFSIKSKQLFQTKIGGFLYVLFIFLISFLVFSYSIYFFSQRNETFSYFPRRSSHNPLHDISFGRDLNIIFGLINNTPDRNVNLFKEDVDIILDKKLFGENHNLQEEIEKVHFELNPIKFEAVRMNHISFFSLNIKKNIQIGGDLIFNNFTTQMKISINLESINNIFVFIQEKKLSNEISFEKSNFSVHTLNKQANLLKLTTKKVKRSYPNLSLYSEKEESIIKLIPYLTFQNNSYFEINILASNIIDCYEVRRIHDLDIVFSNCLSFIIISYYIFFYVNRILTYNSSWLYLVNYFFRYTTINSDSNYMKLLFYKDRTSFKVSKTRSPRETHKGRTSSIISKDVEGSDFIVLSENTNLNKKNSVNKLNYVNSNSSYVNSQNSLVTDSKKGLDLDNHRSQKMYHLAQGINEKILDLAHYKEKVFTFLESLSKRKIKLNIFERTFPQKYKRKTIINFIYSKKVLEEYLSIERYIKSVSDLEKLKQFLFDKSQLNLFNSYYLNSYNIENSKEVAFSESELKEILSNKLADENTKVTNNKLIQMFNNEMLNSIN